MKAFKYFIGIDISKLTVDVALLKNEEVILQTKIDNTESALWGFFRKISLEHKAGKNNVFICVEKMGIYNTFLCNVVTKRKLQLCQESPLRIKKSLGIQRGKNDAVDAVRIARYAISHFSQLKIWHPPRPIIEEMKALLSLRNRIKKAREILSKIKKSESYYLTKSKNTNIASYTNNTLAAMNTDLLKVEAHLDTLVANDEKVNHLMQIVCSVPCIGPVIGREIIVRTNEFESITTAKQFASHCGIAPFEWTSGTSVKGKTRVSFYGDKSLKALLHIAAMVNIRCKTRFLGKYYARKVEEGKNKMSILNAVRNKLVHRVFACIRDDKMFVEPS
jgi:transposase